MLRQLAFIISGFIIGQGSMFLVQSSLVLDGRFELIANVGIALGILSLMQWAADGGGVFLLSKLEEEEEFSKILINYIVARFLYSSIFFTLIIIILNFIILDDIVRQVFLFIPFIILIWSCNFTGLIDKLEKNNIVGPMSGLNWLFCSLVLLQFNKSEYLGFYLGAAYLVGVIITVLFQYFVIKKIIIFDFELSIKRIKFSLDRIFGFNLAYLTSQGYARFIPILINSFVSSDLAGMYIYAKNVSNTVSQFVQFTRRIEFSKVLLLANENNFSFIEFIKIQKYSFISILIALLIVVMGYLFSVHYNLIEYIQLLKICVLLVFILCIWLVSSSYGQLFIARDQVSIYGVVISSTSVISSVCMVLLIDHYGIYSVMVIEALMLCLQILIYHFALKRFISNANTNMC